MANAQPTALQNPPNANPNSVPQPEPVTPITAFLRFLYTGSSKSSIPVKSPPDLTGIENKLLCVVQMATAREELVISTIRKVYQSKLYIRVDEILIALAYCAKQMHSEKLRTLANNEAISLINDQADFLLFVHYYKKISAIIRTDGHTHFAYGMCRVIEKWYEKYTPVDLANMFGEHRGLHGLTHQSVIKKAHMRTKKRTPNEATNTNVPATNSAETNSNAANNSNSTETNANVIENANAPSTSNGGATSTMPQNADSATQNNATSSNTQPTASPLSTVDDREQVFQFVFCSGGQDYLKYLEDKPQLGEGAQRLKTLQILKTNENINSAVECIRNHNFKLEQMPAHLLEKQAIWEALLPTLSSQSLLIHFHTLKDRGFLNEDTPFTRSFLNVFGNPSKFKSEKICPIYLYIQKKLYSQNKRYLGVKKAEYYEKKVMKRKVSTNRLIEERLDCMFNQALFNATPTPAKFFIVMDLRRGNAKKAVLRNKHINCFEAAFLLTYSIFVREKDAMVFSFTDSKEKLEQLHPIMPKNDFAMAKEAIELQTVPRTHQSLAKPIAEATALNKKVDIFLVIVDSVARFCRQGQVPVKEFTEYRKKFNEHAKYVVINLTRPKPDVMIPETDNMKGFIEICGFSQDTPKIINAVAKHCFA